MDSNTNRCSSSHKCGCGLHTIQGAPAGDRPAARRASAKRFGRRNRRNWQTIQVRFVSAPETQWVLRMGDHSWRYIGCLTLDDVLPHFLGERR